MPTLAEMHVRTTTPLHTQRTCATTRPHRMAHMSRIWACTRPLLLRQLSTSTLSAGREQSGSGATVVTCVLLLAR